MSHGFYLVGEAPNPATRHRPDLWLLPDDGPGRHSANRLRDYAGLTTEQYLELFPWRDNVWSEPIRRPMVEGRRRALEILTAAQLLGDRRCLGLVLLGSKVAEVFGLSFEPFRYQWIYGISAVVVPHPSGRSRWWNDAGRRVIGERRLAEFWEIKRGRDAGGGGAHS